ncbi:class I adenylate-forming enzyme family protein [Paralcaligenes ureilyticus]|uniref:Acyl-CoA synthetase (AMP-forming)/AMP-acid ligase II n=1 Tax=Paralcaligenes ureilyticus TaxID=627131 RepID=A0A4R3LVK3_9BURK|nr:AMP-binding protein [Paralcaligenes ureilyticus]TCT03709.1 acyl-CoA synthetase (AMP-forming)/AMP-acid ligase II [Paralcaligenes ureilyticus]
MNLIDFFDKSARLYPNRVAAIFEDRQWLYRDVLDLATRIGNGLRSADVSADTKCAVLSRNDPIAFISMLGILKAQGVWVPLNPSNAKSQSMHILNAFDVEVLFFEKEEEDFARAAKEECPGIKLFLCVNGPSTLGATVEPWAASQSPEPQPSPWAPEALCWLRGTGGTTGLPKGVMNTNRNFETMMANFRATLSFDEAPVYLACAPLSHTAAVLSMVTFGMGGTLIIHRKFEAQATLKAIQARKVSFVYLPPTAIYSLLSQPNVHEFDYSSLRHFIYGAAPISSTKLHEAIDVFGPVMTQVYGQTEVPTSVTYMSPADHLSEDGSVNEKRLLSCGKPAPFSRVALMDDSGKLVPPGSIGEIVVQGGLVMKGYYKNPEATAEVSTYGWHHTGDLAYQDEDGFIYICDRKKEMIITGGYNVYPLEVEQAVLSHPAVQDCAVVGVPDEKWGEAIKAVVEVKKGFSLTEDELLAFCKAKVGSVRTPKSVDFIDELPRSGAGKVMRKEVRKHYWTAETRNV